MRVAVITPYFKEPLEFLRECHESVLRQTHPCLHVMVADGLPQEGINGWQVDHVILPKSHDDVGSTPRFVGCCHAIGLGFDAVAFLDADNWYSEDHIASLVALAGPGIGFISSNRTLCRLDGSSLAPCPWTDPEKFVDTSCMFFARPAFPLLMNWILMPDYAHPMSDRVMFHHVRQSGVSRAHNPERTVFYRVNRPGIYRRFGEQAPPGVEPRPKLKSLFARWEAEGNPPLT